MKHLIYFFTCIINLHLNGAFDLDNGLACVEAPFSRTCQIKSRRYDINHMGRNGYFRGWVDVQGQGAANDFCRIVDNIDSVMLTCALAGTHGEIDRNYNSSSKFDVGANSTWYMKDEDGDGRDDYCRCVRRNGLHSIVCTKAGPLGFYGSTKQKMQEYTFSPSGTINCSNIRIHPQLGMLIP